MMNGKIRPLFVTLFVCLITSCSTLSPKHPTQLNVQNIARQEKDRSDLERWDSIVYCNDTVLHGSHRQRGKLTMLCLNTLIPKRFWRLKSWHKRRGEYLDGQGSGRRNSHLMAVAPNASSGVILSTSPSIEPTKANAYTHRTRAGSFLVKNPYLIQLLQEKGEE